MCFSDTIFIAHLIFSLVQFELLRLKILKRSCIPILHNILKITTSCVHKQRCESIHPFNSPQFCTSSIEAFYQWLILPSMVPVTLLESIINPHVLIFTSVTIRRPNTCVSFRRTPYIFRTDSESRNLRKNHFL